jgi:hypothetical protein
LARDKTHILAMTGSYFRGDAEAVLHPEDESKFDTVTYTYYEQLNGYEYLKQLDIGYYFYTDSYTDTIMKVLNPNEKTILHIPNVNSHESTKDKIREVEHIIEELGEWQGTDPKTGFQLVKPPDGTILQIADLVDDDSTKRDKVSTALKDAQHGDDRDIFERLYAVRLDRLRESEECRAVLRSLDTRGFLDAESETSLSAEADLTDEALLASLGVSTDSENDVTHLKHVRSRNEIKRPVHS